MRSFKNEFCDPGDGQGNQHEIEEPSGGKWQYVVQLHFLKLLVNEVDIRLGRQFSSRINQYFHIHDVQGNET